MQKYIFWPLILSLLVGILLAGCSSRAAGPATVPVKGKLVFLRGGDARTIGERQGIIEFASIDHPGVRAFGEIQEDGSFQLISVQDDQASVGSEGIVPGAHRVCLRLDATSREFVAPQFLDLERSKIVAQVSGNEEIVIQVWR